MTTVDEALQEFQSSALTCKMLRSVYKVVPYSPELPHFSSVDDATRMLKADASDADMARARDIAHNTEELADLLWMARLLDAGDKGYTILTGLWSAVKMFRAADNTGRVDALDTDNQQRNDAILKALGISYMVHKAYPGGLTEKAAGFRDSQTGQAIAVYYGAIEVALPFADNAAVSGSSFLTDLFGSGGSSQANRLASMAGGRSIEGAQAMLGTLTEPLQRVVSHATKYTKPIADAAGPYVPGLMSGADKVAGVVAGAADVMPVYRLLGARLAAESAARRALIIP